MNTCAYHYLGKDRSLLMCTVIKLLTHVGFRDPAYSVLVNNVYRYTTNISPGNTF